MNNISFELNYSESGTGQEDSPATPQLVEPGAVAGAADWTEQEEKKHLDLKQIEEWMMVDRTQGTVTYIPNVPKV